MKNYWIYRVASFDNATTLLLKNGYILITASNLPCSEKDTFTPSDCLCSFLKFDTNDIIVVPTERQTISIFKINKLSKVPEEWNKIKEIFLKNSSIEYVERFKNGEFENFYIVKVTILKDHIHINDCTNMEFIKYLKEHRTCRDISRYAEEIESILNDSQKTSDASYLLKELLESNNIREYIDMHKDSIRYSDPVGYLQDLLIEKGLSVAKVGKYSGQGDYVYKIFKGEREPSRDVLLAIAIGMKMSLKETQNLLRLFKFAELNVKDGRDVIIIFGILKKKSIHEVDNMLFSNVKTTILR